MLILLYYFVGVSELCISLSLSQAHFYWSSKLLFYFISGVKSLLLSRVLENCLLSQEYPRIHFLSPFEKGDDSPLSLSREREGG